MTDHERERAGSGGNGTDDDPTGPSRRRLLRGTAALGAAGLAGCTGSIPGVGGDGGGGGDGDDPGPDVTDLTPTDCEPEKVSSDITSDTTWNPQDCPRIALSGNVRVIDGATLTIEPGVEVVGTSGSRITVKANSTLQAQGDPENPVWFYGETATPGFWEGIRFRSETDNVLDNVVLQHGGQGNYANVYLDDSSTASVTNTLSERSSTAGLVATGGTTLTEFSNNLFRDNEFAAMEVRTPHLGSLDSGSQYAAENAEDVVHVVNADVESDATWPALGVPYRFRGGNHRIFSAVTVDPGASFVFESGGRITVKSEGSFAAEGSEDDPITFEGETATPGFWEGIRLRSNNPNNSFDHVEVAHGGQSSYANIYLDDSSTASITNTRSSQSATSGVVATGGTTLREFSSNTFEENEFAAVEVPTHEVGAVDADSTYAGGNEHDAVYVVNVDVEEDATWAAAPYRFRGGNHRVFSAVTVDPGASFVFEEGGRITVKSNGSFAAEGSGDATTTFEGATDTRGFWEGIRFRSNNPNNGFDNVEIANGGKSNYANVYLDDNSQASVTNSTLRASATYGIVVTSGASLESSNNTFQNNAEGAIRNENES